MSTKKNGERVCHPPEQQRQCRRYLRQICALSAPGIVALVLGVSLFHSALWRMHADKVSPQLGEISAIAIFVTVVGGVFFNGATLVLLYLLIKLSEASQQRKVLAGAAVLLSLAGFVLSCRLVANLWGD
jgi:hypothetical protein